jgi:hypothetical protein
MPRSGRVKGSSDQSVADQRAIHAVGLYSQPMTPTAVGRAANTPRWLVPTAFAVVALAALVSLPMAFGIVMSSEDFPNTHNPYLYGLLGLLFVAVGAWTGAVILARPGQGRASRSVLSRRLAACALAAGALILGTFCFEIASVVLGF